MDRYTPEHMRGAVVLRSVWVKANGYATSPGAPGARRRILHDYERESLTASLQEYPVKTERQLILHINAVMMEAQFNGYVPWRDPNLPPETGGPKKIV